MRQAVHQPDPGRRDIEIFRQQADDGLVSLAAGRRCGRSNAQLAAPDAFNGITAGPRMHTHRHTQPAAVWRKRSGIASRSQIPIGRSERRKMSAPCSRMIANIGEMSRPPIGLMTVRNGRRTGSTSMLMNAVAGL